MVWALVGKEFPDMRQSEREIKVIRVRDTIRTAGQLRREPSLNRGPQSNFIPRVQGAGQGSCQSFADWMRHISWGEGGGWRVRQRPSPYGVGGETGYIAQEDLKSVNSYNMGEGRMIRVWFSIPAFHSSLVLSALLSLGHCFCPSLYFQGQFFGPF